MTITTERRKRRGVAIVTERSSIKWRYESAGIRNGFYSVQDGNKWPDFRPPLVLDTMGMPPQVLVELLANPPQAKKVQPHNELRLPVLSEPQASKLLGKPQYVPLIALAIPCVCLPLLLLKLSPTVQLVGPVEP